MALTAKQEQFAQELANGKSQIDAYRAAYNCEKMSEQVIRNEASKLAANHDITVMVDSLKAKLAEKQLWKREDSVRILREIAEAEAENATAKIASIKELNAMHGFNAPVKVDHLSSDGSMSPVRPEELSDEQLAAIAARGS